MPAIPCHSCRKLISDQESHCPFCGSPQTIERSAGKISKAAFADPTAVISWIVGMNVLLYVGSVLLDYGEALSMERGILALGAPTSESLVFLGMTGSAMWTNGHWWTLITASFLHGSLLHIFFNMSWLKQLGAITVALLGPARFILIYIVTGIGGFLLSNLYYNAPTIGASCSIFGLMGVLAAFGQRRGGVIGKNLNRQIWAWAIIGLIIGFAMTDHGINNAGHIGGLVSGYILGFLLPKQESTRESGILQLSALILMAITFLSFGWNIWVMQAEYSKQREIQTIERIFRP